MFPFDDKTGKVIEGKETSILIEQGQLNFAEKSFNATIFTDTNTGKKLAIDGRKDNIWEWSKNGNSWVLNRDQQTKGEVFGSLATKHFGEKAGGEISDLVDGVGEAGGFLKNVWGPKSPTPPEPNPVPYPHKYSKYPPK